jgi:hypothetical protein
MTTIIFKTDALASTALVRFIIASAEGFAARNLK